MKFNEIRTQDGVLATYCVGQGPLLVFIHGGPGDTHHYLRQVAPRLASDFTCVLYDQRGTGRSFVENKTSSIINLQKYIEDLDAVLDYYRADRASLLGHSWGAMLGLFYNISKPEKVSKSALVSMGPLTDEYGKLNSLKTTEVLNSDEKQRWRELREARSKALAAADAPRVLMIDNEMMHLRVSARPF